VTLSSEQLATAACRGKSTTLFIEPRHPQGSEWAAVAKQICAVCPLTGRDGPCARDADDTMEWSSVRGGLTGQERRGLSSRRCVGCGVPLPLPSGRGGRPQRFCGPVCYRQHCRLTRGQCDV